MSNLLRPNDKRAAKGMYWDRAWSLTRGCTRVSPGCDHCWAERMSHIRRNNPNSEVRDQYGMTNNAGRWTGKAETLERNLSVPCHVKKPTVFTIWNDLYHEDVPWNFIFDAYRVIEQCPQHLFVILTKRPERMRRDMADIHFHLQRNFPGLTWPLPNVIHGTTAENQEQADKRVSELLRVPGYHMLSVEPMLGPVVVDHWLGDNYSSVYGGFGHGIDLVVCGCESGPGARPMETEWAVDLWEQCKAAGVAFWMKQMMVGGKLTHDLNDFPEELRAREWI